MIADSHLTRSVQGVGVLQPDTMASGRATLKGSTVPGSRLAERSIRVGAGFVVGAVIRNQAESISLRLEVASKEKGISNADSEGS
jgi:hypothetical protein